jgi:hypothetical protein
MSDDSVEASQIELEMLLDLPISPTAKKAIRMLKMDWAELEKIDPAKDVLAYSMKKQALIRSEYHTQDMLQKDEKYAKLAADNETLAARIDAKVERERILALGDFYRGNLNQLRLAAQDLTKEKNVGKKSAEKVPNLLGDKRPWGLILKDLDAETLAYDTWKAEYTKKTDHGETETTKAPERKLANFINDAAARLNRPPSLAQIRFEMSEYQACNHIAHNGLDAALLEAKKAQNADSPLWELFAAIILTERQKVDEGNIPKRLHGQEKRIEETLLIYQFTHFASLKKKEDPHNGDWIPGTFTIARQHLSAIPEIQAMNDNITKRVLDFKPTNTYEGAVVEEYLEAAEELKSVLEDVEEATGSVTIAQHKKTKAEKARRVATQRLRAATSAFLIAEEFRKKEAMEEEEEAVEMDAVLQAVEEVNLS